jgi:hypothetical protein
MSKRPMTPLTLSVYRLVTANGCSLVDELVAVCRDRRGERGLCNV